MTPRGSVSEPAASPVAFQVTQSKRTEPLRECVRDALDNYFKHLDGHAPTGLYQMVMSEVELPLLQTVMEQLQFNQSRAAQVLGISRGTLRKKLAQYGLD